uniref:Thermonuclease family protein n=1 Tax=Phenylobacterium glaciei TaxID=2803784 RepID=A0A974S8U4_9CAUL|nr:thermonuclease family protein [Phenylobacterium glaciei]
MGVTDGDTITLLTDDKASLKVRLVEIDAPEKGQPWGARSKRFLSSLIYSKRVRVVEAGRDRYGRTLGRSTRATGTSTLRWCAVVQPGRTAPTSQICHL